MVAGFIQWDSRRQEMRSRSQVCSRFSHLRLIHEGLNELPLFVPNIWLNNFRSRFFHYRRLSRHRWNIQRSNAQLAFRNARLDI